MARETLRLNHRDNVFVERLDWKDEKGYIPLIERYGHFDLIIASDVVYLDELFEYIWKTIDFFLKPNSKHVVMTHTVRTLSFTERFLDIGKKAGYQRQDMVVGDLANILDAHSDIIHHPLAITDHRLWHFEKN
eukprot:TRINITY_DN7381_c0_g1_i1.p1 TRINITY_DN7381_c0_g1~~TRINITY_DN7381_c0_g1_i1.p1  ORF type:complete len:133 (-),score=26.42 TRINITY_DN7381_c0_g1_i1:18-416(-)